MRTENTNIGAVPSAAVNNAPTPSSKNDNWAVEFATHNTIREAQLDDIYWNNWENCKLISDDALMRVVGQESRQMDWRIFCDKHRLFRDPTLTRFDHFMLVAMFCGSRYPLSNIPGNPNKHFIVTVIKEPSPYRVDFDEVNLELDKLCRQAFEYAGDEACFAPHPDDFEMVQKLFSRYAYDLEKFSVDP